VGGFHLGGDLTGTTAPTRLPTHPLCGHISTPALPTAIAASNASAAFSPAFAPGCTPALRPRHSTPKAPPAGSCLAPGRPRRTGLRGAAVYCDHRIPYRRARWLLSTPAAAAPAPPHLKSFNSTPQREACAHPQTRIGPYWSHWYGFGAGPCTSVGQHLRVIRVPQGSWGAGRISCGGCIHTHSDNTARCQRGAFAPLHDALHL
jgi:hypothetical protein